MINLVLKTPLFSNLRVVHKNATTHVDGVPLRGLGGLEIGRVIKMYLSKNYFKIRESRKDEVRKCKSIQNENNTGNN